MMSYADILKKPLEAKKEIKPSPLVFLRKNEPKSNTKIVVMPIKKNVIKPIENIDSDDEERIEECEDISNYTDIDGYNHLTKKYEN
jgi:hypothetical protein